ncbi:uncharacterized protein LOC133315268 [Gastrolobium bilobum]|uniref:uncharacterized protein LOC133315268 n=1 Tax=Gastrolobium bilobum TaxID=150636 RepID=UPI002AB13355|nr:uncharacterized protein LOC133315268 [Gastrolobium bilobum]
MYSTSKMKPPRPRSPMHLRTRRVLQSSNSTSLQTPPGSLTKSQKPVRSPDMDLRPEYRTISCELRTLAKMVRDEFGNAGSENVTVANSRGLNQHSLFERGRFYDEYSARRNERLKRKKGMTVDEGKAKPAHAHALGVTVESGKKSGSRKFGSLRKSVSRAYSVEVSETPRYNLRSMTKENKKPPRASSFDKSVICGEKKTRARGGGRI